MRKIIDRYRVRGVRRRAAPAREPWVSYIDRSATDAARW